jgi:hypothetical protein
MKPRMPPQDMAEALEHHPAKKTIQQQNSSNFPHQYQHQRKVTTQTLAQALTMNFEHPQKEKSKMMKKM